MKTPAPQRAASRKKLAATGQALSDGTAPIPNVAYLKKAIRAKGRVDPSKWPALKALIVKRAKQLKATNTPGVKGTWAFQGSNDGAAIELVGPKGYEHGWIKVGGEADKHIALAKKADAEGRHADAINHLGAAISRTSDKSAAFHLTELKKEMAARAMGVPYKAKPMPKRLHAPASDPEKAKSDKANRDFAWPKSGPGTWTARSNAYTITRGADGYVVRDGSGRQIAAKKTLKAAQDSVQVHANDTEAIDLATPRRMPVVRGAADVQLSRTGPGQITAMHKSSGMKIGTITPSGKGYAGSHADGKATGASGSQQGALTGLIAYHNAQAAKAKAGMAADGATTYTAGERDAVDLAGALPVSTPAASSSDGPRVTSMGAGKLATASDAPSGLSAYGLAVYRKFIAKGMKPAVAAAFAKRADAMHAKAA